MEEVKIAVFEENELEYRDISLLKTLLPLHANQDSGSGLKNIFHDY